MKPPNDSGYSLAINLRSNFQELVIHDIKRLDGEIKKLFILYDKESHERGMNAWIPTYCKWYQMQEEEEESKEYKG